MQRFSIKTLGKVIENITYILSTKAQRNSKVKQLKEQRKKRAQR
jgi:hypothetical protein